jgi:Zn-dependent protease
MNRLHGKCSRLRRGKMNSALSLACHTAMQMLAAFFTYLLWGSVHLLIHESGHVMAALVVGSRIKQVGISKLGPFVRRESARTPLRNVIVALAGPGINILTWAVFLVFRLPHAWIALAFGLLNLLPLPNSDSMKSISYMRHP